MEPVRVTTMGTTRVNPKRRIGDLNGFKWRLHGQQLKETYWGKS